MDGLEPHGTDIGKRMTAWNKLQENTGPGRSLSLLPRQLSNQPAISYGHGSREGHPSLRLKRMVDWNSAQDSSFCDSPGERYAQLVFRSGNSASLWSVKAIRSMCEMEQARIRSHAHFQDLCKQDRLDTGGALEKHTCCPSWSLGNYLAVLSNASSCLGLTATQVSQSLSLLRQCAPYYHDRSLDPSCAQRGKQGPCTSVPLQCKRSSAIYQILHYLVDKDFLGPQTTGYQVPSLKYSLLFLPVEKGDAMMKIYLDSLEGRDLTYRNTTITGMDLGIKRRLFKYYLAQDSIYPVLAAVMLLVTMALYLRSFVLSALSLAAIIVSLFASYFFYKVAFRLTFFPFLNITAILLLLGSSSNQAFTFIDLWSLQLSQNPPASLEKRVNQMLQEVGYLILVSGLTSSATFYSGFMSSITTVRCFAVYLGTTSLISTLFALVWLPCALVLRERYSLAAAGASPARKSCCSLSIGEFWATSLRKLCLFTMVRKLRSLKRGLSETSDLLFLKILPCGVVKFRYIWICWFAVLAVGGTYITCVDPGMKLPSLESKATQLFRSSHPFERYDSEYRHQFMFERLKSGEDKPMTISLVWGVLPSDSGDPLDPSSSGSLVMDPEFNMSSPEAQRHAEGHLSNTGGPRFDSDGRVAALVIEFKTTQLYSFNFSQTTRFYRDIERWFNAEISGAPPGLHNGWFVSQLTLYDLQQCLNSETLVVTSFSVAMTFAFLLLTTWNIPLSVFGAVAVGGSVFVTVGLLVLLEWQLSGLEALFISAAAGLSVDFAANYCISYSLAPHSDRLGRVAHSIKRMGCPVATGAGTYFCMGIIMLPTTALLFRKLGIFLLLVKCVACGFATFFFQSLCCFFGPQKNCGQIFWPCTGTVGQYKDKETENMLSPCSASGPSSSNNTANGAFGCGGRARVERRFDKGTDRGHLCPGQHRHRQRHQGGGEPEQYELQPLACQLSDSFENSTCTSKLSNRPSVVSDDIQFRSPSPRRDVEAMSIEGDSENLSCEHFKGCHPPPAVQTSSPYKENTLQPVIVPPVKLTKERLLCRQCQNQPGGMKHWNVSLSSSSSMEDIVVSTQPPEAKTQRSLSTEGASSSPLEHHPHRRLLSSQSQSSFEGLEDTRETCLSDTEPGSSDLLAPLEAERELKPGHLNGKRDTLRLSLKETVFESASKGTGRSRMSQGDVPVILPNSKPDLPDDEENSVVTEAAAGMHWQR
ncbi:protein dispatched2-like, partial [Scleropages formosus]